MTRVIGLDIHRVFAEAVSIHPVTLSITHKLGTNHGAKPNVV
jgi:hypothetical protein